MGTGIVLKGAWGHNRPFYPIKHPFVFDLFRYSHPTYSHVPKKSFLFILLVVQVLVFIMVMVTKVDDAETYGIKWMDTGGASKKAKNVPPFTTYHRPPPSLATTL